MKKVFLLFTTMALLFSCATPQAVKESKKEIKGEWTLNSITYSEPGTYNVTMLNDASKDCFEGSSWRFIPNNNTGVYTISSAGCTPGDRYFNFTIAEMDKTTGLYDFLLKPTDERGRSESNVGFRMRLAHLTGTNMRWEQNLTVDGKPFTILMNFTKLN